MVRVNEISEELDFCSGCKIGYLKLTGEVVVKGKSTVDIEISVPEEYSNVIIVNKGKSELHVENT